MKRTFYLPDLTPEQGNRLAESLHYHFPFKPSVVFGEDKFLRVEFATMGRDLYPNESCEATPFKLGKPVSVDSIRWEQISCYVNGFCKAIDV